MDEPTIDAVAGQLRQRLSTVDGSRAPFLGTYLRTTEAVGAAVADGSFEDPDWVARWDVAFAGFYLDALDRDLAGQPAPRPWRLAFSAPAGLPPLRQVLLGINAHVNYDLPQALLAVISPADFADPVLLARRQRDHERIDAVLSERVGAEDSRVRDSRMRDEQSRTDRLLRPANRAASRRFLREARQKVWHNAVELNAARLRSEAGYRERLAELEVLSAAKIADLLAPGQVLLRLAVSGFGVLLPPA